MDESFEREVLQRLTALETKVESLLNQIKEEIVTKNRDTEARLRILEDWKTSFVAKATVVGSGGILGVSIFVNMVLSYFGIGH